MGLKHNLVHIKYLWWCLFIKSWCSSHHLYARKRCNDNTISTFPPCYLFCTWLVCSGSLTRMELWNNYELFCICISTRAETAPAMAIHAVFFSLFQPIPAIWSYLELFGDFQSYIELFRATWSLLEPFGAIWCHMVPLGAFWSRLELLEPFEAIWSNFEPIVAIESHLEPFRAISCRLESFGVISSHLEPFGGILSNFDQCWAIWSDLE